MIQEKELIIPIWEKGVWGVKVFEKRNDFKEFVLPLFKEPGQYLFDETSYMFNEQAILYRKNKFFCEAPKNSKDYVSYWDDQKEKCRNGVIFVNGNKTWYLPREYYMWLNFLPIKNKETAKFDFPDVRDAQYHIALYELLAELHYKHCAITKKRQIASSYYHAGKLLNQIWFEEGVVLQIGAKVSNYVKKTWNFLNEYKDFLNKNTAWTRDFTPGAYPEWKQIDKQKQNGRWIELGLKGVLRATSFEKSETSGVGGESSYFFYEEAGIAPTMDSTFEFLRPAMQSGFVTTGLFIAAGSVGQLDECKPLKSMTLYPDAHDIYAVTSNLIDNKGTIANVALFIPEQWSMQPFIDVYGNSLVEDALTAILVLRKQWKKDLTPENYQLRISQHPTNLEEAYKSRKESKFPLHLVGAQKQRIEDKDYSIEYLDIYKNELGNITVRETNKLPIKQFPIVMNEIDKTGVLVVHERPVKDVPFGLYYASVDPVSEGKAEYINNRVYTPSGRKRIGNIKIGDQVIGSNGKAINVTGVYPQGIKKLCRVTFSDRHSILICEDHLWSVTLIGGTKGYRTLSTKDLLDVNKQITYTSIGRNSSKEYTISTYYKNNRGAKWSIPIVSDAISFTDNTDEEIPIDPYLLGLLLGDGGISGRSIRFSSIDEEIISSLKKGITDDLQVNKVKGNNCDYSITTKVGTRNTLTAKLRNLNLQGKKSEFKFIPNIYKYNFIDRRLALLQGLMDTDGSCTNHGAEFYSSSKQLAYDVVELVQSLGGISKIRMKKTTHLDSYIVRVLLPKGLCPFRLSRKKEKYTTSKVFSRYIIDIQYERDDEAVCISVDSSDNLYITEHAIVTHNTTTSESLCSIYVYKNPREVQKDDGSGVLETYIDPDKIVAWWCGRHDDIKKTHKMLELIIEYYNAWTVVENNIPSFITYMIDNHKQRYLVPKSQMLFLKDLNANATTHQEYGWRNTGILFKGHLLNYLIEWLNEEINTIEIVKGAEKSVYGIERIPDIMAMVEMEAYQEGLNVDRLVALSALVSFAKVQQANRAMLKFREKTNGEYNNKFTKFTKNIFRNIGQTRTNNSTNTYRNPFKNIR